jgi:hypothetical protein
MVVEVGGSRERIGASECRFRSEAEIRIEPLLGARAIAFDQERWLGELPGRPRQGKK